MRIKAFIVLAAAVAGVAVAAMVATPAHAWDIGSLPAGYNVATVFDASGTDASPTTCRTSYHVQGYGGDFRDGACDPNFQANLDAFVDSTCPCAQTTSSIPPAASTPAPATTAGTTTIVPPPTSTDTTATVTSTVAETSTVVSTTTVAATATTTATTTAAADGTATQLAALASRVTLLEQRSDADEARLSTIEAQLGIIVGEPKNQPPFVAPGT